MKKHLIAAAVAAAVAVPAVAQVTVYGTIDAGVATANKVGATEATSVSQSNVQGSLYTSNRFGIRGSEDLGGGLKGAFGVESGFNSDTTSALDFGSRGAFVGASGAFGSIKLGGRMTSLVDNAVTGPSGNFSSIGNLVTAAASARPSNSLVYETPTFNGIRGQVVLGKGEATTQLTKDNGNYQSVGASGKIGAFSFTVVRASSKSQAGAGTASRCVLFFSNQSDGAAINLGNNTGIATGASDGSCTIGASAAASSAFTFNGTTGSSATNGVVLAALAGGQITTLTAGVLSTGAFNYKTEETGLVLGYDFGMAAVQYNTLLQKTTGTLGTGTTTSATAATNAAVDRRAQGITVTVPFGAITPFVSYMELDEKTTGVTNDVDMTAIGANYALSKRTNAYAVWSAVERGSAATTKHRGATADGVAGTKSSGMAVGLRHSF